MVRSIFGRSSSLTVVLLVAALLASCNVVGGGTVSAQMNLNPTGQDIAVEMLMNLDALQRVQIVSKTTTQLPGGRSSEKLTVRLQKPDHEEVIAGNGTKAIRAGKKCFAFDTSKHKWIASACMAMFPATYYAWTDWMHVASPHYKLVTKSKQYILTWSGAEAFNRLKATVTGRCTVDRARVLPMHCHGTVKSNAGTGTTDIGVDFHTPFTIRPPK